MSKRRLRNEDGASLIVVLIFITVFGLIISGLLTEAGASVRYTNTVSDHEKKVYAADAGVAFGISQVRQNNNLCPSMGDNQTLQPITVNGRTVSVSCTGTLGSTLGALGYAIITTSNSADSLTLQSGGEKVIKGPVYLGGGTNDWSSLTVNGGNVSQVAGTNSCGASAAPAGLYIDDQPANSTTSTASHRFCKTTAPVPNPPHDAPGSPPNTSTFASGHRNPVTSGSCTIWYPGLYTTPPSLTTTDNYFASGVYYFNFTGRFNVDENIFGGQPAPGETRTFTPPTCADHEVTGASEVTGTGVQFVFGSGAWMDVQKVTLELFSRTGGSGTSGISFIAVPPDSANSSDHSWTAAGWAPNTLADPTPIIDMHNGNVPDFAIHGVVYTWKQLVRLWATNDVDAQAVGGIVASTVELQSSGSGGGLAVSVVGGHPVPRHVLIKASAAGTSGTERAVESSAIVAVDNDPTKPSKVQSWRTRGPIDVL